MIHTKKCFVLLALYLFAQLFISADPPVFSGFAEGAANFQMDAKNNWNYGFEEFANLRFATRVGESARVVATMNTSATSGLHLPLSVKGELERLYATVRTDTADIDFGLLRLPFGFGIGYKPTDIFAVPTPLFPEARVKGVLGTVFSLYPHIENKIQFFICDQYKEASLVEEKNVHENVPSTGIAFDHHGKLGSFQSLYVYTPTVKADEKAKHFFALSGKIDIVVGFVCDALYIKNENAFQVASGIDYSFLKGKLYFLVQHYWDGLEFEHALFSMVSYQYSDYLHISLSNTAKPYTSDIFPIATLSYEAFQGVTITSKTHLVYQRKYQSVGSSLGATVRF